MVSLFRDKNPAVVFRIIILSAIVHIHFFIVPPAIIMPSDKSLLYYVLAPLQSFPSIVISLLYHAIIIIQALRLNYLINNCRMFPTFGYTTAMCYILFTALLPIWENITNALIINFFILLILHVFMRMINTQYALKTIFDCGLVTGVTVLLYPSFAVIILVGLIGILIIRSFRLNEIFSYLCGVVIPFYFLGSILFLYNKFGLMKNLIPQLSFHLTVPTNKIIFLITSIILSVCVLLGFVSMQNNMGKLIISARKLWIIFVVALILSISTLLFSSGIDWTLSLFIVIPACAAISANLFYYSRSKIFISLMFWIIVIVSLLNSFGGITLFKK